MAKTLAKNGMLFAGATQISHVRNVSLDETSPQIDLTTMGQNFADQSSGLPAISGAFELILDPDDTGQGLVVNGAEFTLEIYYNGNGSGSKYKQVNIAITSDGLSGAFDGAWARNVQYVGRSLPTIEQVP